MRLSTTLRNAVVLLSTLSLGLDNTLTVPKDSSSDTAADTLPRKLPGALTYCSTSKLGLGKGVLLGGYVMPPGPLPGTLPPGSGAGPIGCWVALKLPELSFCQ